MPDQTNQIDDREAYDLDKIYEAEIGPLIDQVEDICGKHRIPFMTFFQLTFKPRVSLQEPDVHGTVLNAFQPVERTCAPAINIMFRTMELQMLEATSIKNEHDQLLDPVTLEPKVPQE